MLPHNSGMIGPQAFDEQWAILRVEHRTVCAAQTGPVCASIRSRTAWLRSFQSVRCTVISESLAVEAGNELDFILTDDAHLRRIVSIRRNFRGSAVHGSAPRPRGLRYRRGADKLVGDPSGLSSENPAHS